jgi:hypothetical protein
MALVRDFKMSSTKGWAVENGDFATVAGAEAVPQGIEIRVGMFLRECFLDESIGLDWPEDILVKNPDPLVIRGLIGGRIAATPDVTNVVGAQLVDQGNRTASIEYVADTVYSEDPLSGQIGVP